MKNTVIKFGSYGLITGFVIFIVHLVFGIDNLDYSTNELFGYISICLALSFIFFGIKHYRDQVNEGYISLGKSITIGILISVFVGVGIAIADYIYTAFINPNFFQDYQQQMMEQGKEDAHFEITSGIAAMFMFVLVTIIGFIISLISGLILQRK